MSAKGQAELHQPAATRERAQPEEQGSAQPRRWLARRGIGLEERDTETLRV